MVLPDRRTSAPTGKRVMMDDDLQAGVESQCRLFPATPHPIKKLRLEEQNEPSTAPPTGSSAGAESATTADTQDTEPFVESMFAGDMESPPRIQNEEEQEEQDDIDWDKLAQCEPAATDIPIFLGALSRKEAANERFAAVLDECHSSLHECVDSLLQTVADVHILYSNQMEAMEADIKHNLVCNDEARAQMQLRLQASATAAQGLFAKLLQRVTEPLHELATNMKATNKKQEAMVSEYTK